MRALLCGGFAQAAGTCGVTDAATSAATVVPNTPPAVAAGQFSIAQKSLGQSVLQVMQAGSSAHCPKLTMASVGCMCAQP